MKHTSSYIPNYPRPQLVRTDWTDLNGEWAFGFDDETDIARALIGDLPRTIIVPFAYQTEASGINDTAFHPYVWYSRKITRRKDKRTILHLDGADYTTSIYINGVLVGSHTGAYSRWSTDITEHLKKPDNVLTIRCDDADHPAQVRGKQRWLDENHGCWYVGTTGLYKTVWLEYVEPLHLTRLKMTPSLVDYTLNVELAVSEPASDVRAELEVSFDGKHVRTLALSADDVSVTGSVRLDSAALVHQVAFWSVDHPALYDITVTVTKAGKVVDRVGSYFGLREFIARDGKILFNNVPYYQRMLLDQGYWPTSGVTPPDDAAVIKDIELTKAMGFNGIRKHQKVEDERFLYYCDILGLLVWCEMPSNHWSSDEVYRAVAREWQDIVLQNYNHPCIVTWVAFNESWGVRNIMQDPLQQNIANALYYLAKSIDPMRPVIGNDGWQHAKSDILTLHHYEQSPEALYACYSTLQKLTEGDGGTNQHMPYANGWKYEGQPIMMTEFGGAAYDKDTAIGWGYGNAVRDDDEFLKRLEGLIAVVRDMNLAGFCYTQTTDIQQEVNGLLREDRTPKISIEKIRKAVTQ